MQEIQEMQEQEMQEQEMQEMQEQEMQVQDMKEQLDIINRNIDLEGLKRIKKQQKSLDDNIHVPIKYARIFELILKIKVQSKLLSYIKRFVKEKIDEKEIKECEILISAYRSNFSRIKITEYCDYYINDYIVQKDKELNEQLLTKCYNDEKEKLYNGIKEIKQSLKKFCDIDIDNNKLNLNEKYVINLIFYVIQNNYRSDNALRVLDIIGNIPFEEEISIMDKVYLEVSKEMEASQFNMMLYEVPCIIRRKQIFDIDMNYNLMSFHQIAVHKYVFDTIKEIKKIIFEKKIEKINELEKLLCKLGFSWEICRSSEAFISLEDKTQFILVDSNDQQIQLRDFLSEIQDYPTYKDNSIIIENYIKSILFYEKEIANNIYEYLSNVELSKLDETQIKFYSLWFLNGKIFEEGDFKKTNKEEVKKEIDKLMYELSCSYYLRYVGLFEQISDECKNKYINNDDKKEYQNSKTYLSSEIRITKEPKIIKNLINLDDLHPSLQLFFKKNKLINNKELPFKYFGQPNLKAFDIIIEYFDNIFISEKQGAQLSFEFSLLEIAEFNLVQQSIIKLNNEFKKIDDYIQTKNLIEKLIEEKKDFKIKHNDQKHEMEIEESDGEEVIKQLYSNQKKLTTTTNTISLLASNSGNNPGGGYGGRNNDIGGGGGGKIPVILTHESLFEAAKIPVDHAKNVAFTVLVSLTGIIISGLTLYLITNAKKKIIEESYDNNNFTNSSTNNNYSVNSSKSNAASILNEDSITNDIRNNIEEYGEEFLLNENDYDEHYNNNGENIDLGDLI